MNEALPCRASWCVVKLHIAQATVRVDSLRVPPVRATCELRVQGLRRTRRHVSVRRSPHADTLRAGYPLRPQSGKTLAENSDTRAALQRGAISLTPRFSEVYEARREIITASAVYLLSLFLPF